MFKEAKKRAATKSRNNSIADIAEEPSERGVDFVERCITEVEARGLDEEGIA